MSFPKQFVVPPMPPRACDTLSCARSFVGKFVVAALSLIVPLVANRAVAIERVVTVTAGGAGKGDSGDANDIKPQGFGFGHREGVEPLVTTLLSGEKGRNITKAEVFAPEAVIWVGPNPAKPPTFKTAAIFPDEAFAVGFRGEFSVKAAKGAGKPPEPPAWAVAANDVDLDFDSDHNSEVTPRVPDGLDAEDASEFADSGPSVGGFGMRVGKEEGWVKLVLNYHAKTDGYLSFQASNTVDFDFADEQGAPLTIGGPVSTPVDEAKVLFQKEVAAGSPPAAVTILAKVSAAGKQGEAQCLVVGQFQPKDPAAAKSKDPAESGTEAVNAIDKGLLKVESHIDFDFTECMLRESSGGNGRMIYPCVTLCNGKNFLRYKTGSTKAADIKEITFTIEDKNKKIVWEAPDVPSTDWKEIFPECRANKDDRKDFDEKPYEIGGKWKYLDPGKNGILPAGATADHSHYPRVSSTYVATMTVSFNGGVPDKVLTLEFDVRSRNVLISRVTDSTYGANGVGSAVNNWGLNAAGKSFARSVNDPNPSLMFRYEESDFREAYSALTPRGRLLLVNHGGRLESNADATTEDGDDTYGGLFMEGPVTADGLPGKSYAGFSPDGAFNVTTFVAARPSVRLGDILEPFGVFVDLAHCWSAHKSGADDSGPSVHETLAATLNTPFSSGRVRGYAAICETSRSGLFVSYNFKLPPGGDRLQAWPIVSAAIKNLIQSKADLLGLESPPFQDDDTVMSFMIRQAWLETHDLSEILPVVGEILTVTNVQAETDRLGALAGVGKIEISGAVDAALINESVSGKPMRGDDERMAQPGATPIDPAWGNEIGKDFDADANPSSSKDVPGAADNPAVLILSDP
jgi:hypothetical protein